MDEAARAAKARFRKHSPELELLLWAVWNPIGLCPLDEYRRYVPAIWNLLAERAGAEAIAAELKRVCDEWLEVDRGNNEETATLLADWWYWRFEYPVELEAEGRGAGRASSRLARAPAIP